MNIGGGIDVDGHTELDNLNVSGISTFTGAIDANGNLDVSGHTELDNVNVSGISTFGGLIDANGNLDVFGTSTLRDTVTVSSGGLTVSSDGATITAGGLTVSAGGADVTGIITANNGLKGNILSPNGTAVLNNGSGNGTNSTFTGTATKADAVKIEGHSTGTYKVMMASDTGHLTPIVSNNMTFDGENFSVTGDLIAYNDSDLRLKTDINPIADALNKVKSISGNTFEWNENSTHEGQDTGVIAQEIEELGLPGLIKERDNGYFGVRYDKLIPLLIEAIKELSDKVDSLEERLNN